MTYKLDVVLAEIQRAVHIFSAFVSELYCGCERKTSHALCRMHLLDTFPQCTELYFTVFLNIRY